MSDPSAIGSNIYLLSKSFKVLCYCIIVLLDIVLLASYKALWKYIASLPCKIVLFHLNTELVSLASFVSCKTQKQIGRTNNCEILWF